MLQKLLKKFPLILILLALPISYQNCSKGFQTLSSTTSMSSLGSSGAGGSCQSTTAARRVWMMSRVEYDNSVAAILGDTSNQAQNNFPPENRPNGFTANASAEFVTSNTLGLVISAAETLAANQAANQVAQLTCSLNPSPSATSMDPCVVSYINTMGLKFYRRPLTNAEIADLYSAYYTGYQNPYTGVSPTTSGIQLVLTAFLEAPQFLYRTELGDPKDTTSPVVSMTQYEIASALSYIVTASPPDDTLLNAAAAGLLNSPANLLAQFNRLLTSQAGHSTMQQFILEWLGADTVSYLGNSNGPLTPAIAADMLTETQYFVDNVLYNGTGTLKELLTANYTYVNAPLAAYYGINPADSTNNFNQVTANSQDKVGLLSQGSFLAASSSSGINILHRGALIRQKLYCQQLPSVASLGLPGFTPPPLGTPAPGQTTRDLLAHTIQQGTACYACHQYFMPIGFGLQHFDQFGRFQITENGAPIDPSGFVAVSNFIDPSSGLIEDPLHANDSGFSNYQSLISNLASDPLVNNCFAAKMFTYATARNDVALNECGVSNLQSQFTSSGANIFSGFSQFVQSASFTQRAR